MEKQVYYTIEREFIMTKRYIVDFYDMIDGWCHSAEFWGREYDSLEDAKRECDNLMKDLNESNKQAGEHYGVIDTTKHMEVYCTRQGGSGGF
jgi:hypothetical protein